MGRDSDVLVGLDLGTKKIVVAVAEREEDEPGKAQIIGVGHSDSRGFRKGMIVNLEQAVGSISDAVADAESVLSGVKIEQVVVAFSCYDVKSRFLHGTITLGTTARQIEDKDVERVIETALSDLQLPLSNVVIHTVPIKYSIDGTGGIDNPLDMTGTQLEVDLTALVIPISIAQNVVNCVERAGLRVVGLILKPLAEALGTLTAEEREIGATVVTIGGGTTSVAVFSDGRLRHAGEIPVGGDHITSDISYIKKIPIALAEDVKKAINISPDERSTGEYEVELRRQKVTLEKEDLADIIESRLDELFDGSIVPCLNGVRNLGLSTDVVFTGGVMLTPGIDRFIEEHLGMAARTGVPVLCEQMQDGRNDCRYTAAAGIIVYINEKRKDVYSYIEPPLGLLKEIVKSKTTTFKQKGSRRPSGSILNKLARCAKDIFKELDLY